MAGNEFEFDYSELRDYIRSLDKLGQYSLAAALPAMDAALFYLHGQLPPYPDPPVRGEYESPLRTPKQRRWFFWALRNGKIQVPYRRTGTLGREITTESRQVQEAVEGEIGTATNYAPWVIGPPFPGEEIAGQTMYQAKIHQGRWWQLENVVEANIEDTWNEFEDVLFAQMLERINAKPGGE